MEAQPRITPAGTGVRGRGVKVGKYTLLAELGRGGMATVHLAVAHGPAGFNKLVVIKQVRSDVAEEGELLAMFLDEARLAARLSHPNVVQTNEVGEQDGHYFMAMEYLEGQPLNRILRRTARTGGLPIAMHLRVIADALAGLHYAHELADYDGAPLEIVHRDANPQNIVVTYDGGVKVVDFGIAKAASSVEQTKAGILKGKIMYMAPEQALAAPVDRRADVFSVGVMLWEAATGRRPWTGMRELELLERLARGEFPTPRSVQPDVPEALEAIIMKAVARSPVDRYATAAELQSDLEAYLDGLGEHAHPRELGALVARLFAEERRAIRCVVDAQLHVGSTAAESSLGSLPVIDHPTSVDPTTGPTGGPAEVTPSGTRRSAPTLATQMTASHVATPEGGPRASPPRRTRGIVAWSGLLVTALLLGTGFGVARDRARTAAPGTVTAVASAAPAPETAAPAPAEIELTAWARPEEARLSLDGRLLPGNPFTGRLPRDGATHTLRIEAPGYLPRTEQLVLDHDQRIDATLAAVPAGAVPPDALRHPAGVASGPRAATRPRHPLDDRNPYAE